MFHKEMELHISKHLDNIKYHSRIGSIVEYDVKQSNNMLKRYRGEITSIESETFNKNIPYHTIRYISNESIFKDKSMDYYIY